MALGKSGGKLALHKTGKECPRGSRGLAAREEEIESVKALPARIYVYMYVYVCIYIYIYKTQGMEKRRPASDFAWGNPEARVMGVFPATQGKTILPMQVAREFRVKSAVPSPGAPELCHGNLREPFSDQSESYIPIKHPHKNVSLFSL